MKFLERRGLLWARGDLPDNDDVTNRDHEDWLYQYIPSDPRAVVIDVGAFVGTFTLEAARRVGQVIAYEPHDAARELLLANIAANGFENVTVRAEAVGARQRRVTLRRGGMGTCVDFAGSDVQQIFLDRDLADLDRVDFLKIDVEGYEVEVVHGAIDLLRKHRPMVLVEVHSHFQGCEHNGNFLNDAILPIGYCGRRVWENFDAPGYFYCLYQ